MKTSLLVAVSALSLMWGNVAFAQRVIDPHAKGDELTPITLDTPIEQALAHGSYITPGDDPVIYADYGVRLVEGQSVRIDLMSGDFDAYLELYREGQSESEPLVRDDDGGSHGMDARLRFTAPETGDYVVRVRTFSGTEGGSFSLLVTEQVARTYPEGRTLVMGRAVRGQLDEKSVLDDDDARYAPYRWSAQAGERVALSLASADFDTLISIGQINNGRYIELDQNDDDTRGHGTLDSYLVFTAPSDGTYYIMAKSLTADAEGEFSLKMEEGPKPAVVRALRFDQSVDGELKDDTGTGYGSGGADQWRFRGEAGQRISAVLKSNDFDTFLELYGQEGESLASDDDSDGDLNARLIYTLPTTGEFILEARAIGGGTGSYDLELKALPPTPKPFDIGFGQTREDELKDTSATADDGQRYVAYVFDGKAGQRIQFTVRSGDFDAVSEIDLLTEGETTYEALASDDDGLRQGTDSRLNFTLPEDGRYELRAQGLERDAKGLFSVELTDRGPEPKPGSLLVPSVARGELTDLDSLTEEGQSYDAYEFKAKADEKLRFTLISAAFDAVVEVGESKNTSWRLAESDDDGLSDNHARLDWSAPRDGTYQVRVRGYQPGSSGTYSLIVERRP